MLDEKSGRASSKEIYSEIETRMHLLKMTSRVIDAALQGRLYYSYYDSIYPVTEEMKKVISSAATDMDGNILYVPYHLIYRHSKIDGRILNVLFVSVDKSDWESQRLRILMDLEVACDSIFMDRNKHYIRSILFSSLASDALQNFNRKIIYADAVEVEDSLCKRIYSRICNFFAHLCE